MKIIIGGDVSPINTNHDYFKDNCALFGDFQDDFNTSDLNIINLEVPLTDSTVRITKSGANLKGPVFAAKSLRNSNIHVASLANNHMGDFSDNGVVETLEVCKSNDLLTVGAGANKESAKKPLIINSDYKIGILSFSDTEFGVAKKDKPGVNPLDLCDVTRDILKQKEEVDFSIVLLHEGKEHYEYPSPNLQKICRYICDMGADLVVCQHSHIAGAWETYGQSNIFYGQGNLMFDYANRNTKHWKTGYLIQVELSDGKAEVQQIPFKQGFPGILKLDKSEETEFFTKSAEMKKNVVDEVFIQQAWKTFISKYRLVYFSIFRGHGKWLRKVNTKLGLTNWLYNKKNKAILLNVVRSRVHREVVVDLLENEIKD
jgi:poly-gamma-glutamate synthesis protein (capsule biosynthesis protein)